MSENPRVGEITGERKLHICNKESGELYLHLVLLERLNHEAADVRACEEQK
jgi:hypothetical protein